MKDIYERLAANIRLKCERPNVFFLRLAKMQAVLIHHMYTISKGIYCIYQCNKVRQINKKQREKKEIELHSQTT